MTCFRVGLTFIVCCAGLLLVQPQAGAGPLSTTSFALDDGFGPDSGRWHGTVSIAGAAFGDSIDAKVDWAVFVRPVNGDPGGFQQYLDDQGIAQVDPSAPGELIYVYQIAAVTTASPGVDTLTVGLDATDARGSVVAPAFVPTGAANEKIPTGGGDNTTSMFWIFGGTELHVGDTSSLLVFTSPFAPEYDFLQVNSGLAGAVVSPIVASPSDRIFQHQVPEPATVISMVLCAAAAFCLRPQKGNAQA